jgi:hypothetical protein
MRSRSLTLLAILSLSAPLILIRPAAAGGPDAPTRRTELGTCPAGETCTQSGSDTLCDISGDPCAFDFLPQFFVGRMVVTVNDNPTGADPFTTCSAADNDDSTVTLELRLKKKASAKHVQLRKRIVRLSHTYDVCESFLGNLSCASSQLLCSAQNARLTESAVTSASDNTLNLGFQILPQPIAGDLLHSLRLSSGVPVITSVQQLDIVDHSAAGDPLPTTVRFEVTIAILP